MFISMGKLGQQLEELQVDATKIKVRVVKQDHAVELVLNGLQQVQEINFGHDAAALLNRGELAAVIREAFNEGVLESRRLLKDEVTRKTGIILPHVPGLF